jgi:ribosomal-protein-alanine N-acetyltransferase
MDSIETERLLLRPFAPDDGQRLHTIIGNDPDMTWDGTSRPLERTEETLGGRIRHYKDRGFGIWAVVDKNSGEMIGQAGLQVLTGTTEVELVAYTAKRSWRQGIAREACIAAITYAFTEMNLSKVIAVIRTQNSVAKMLAEKFGFQFDRQDTAYGDPVYYYVLPKSEFNLKNQLYKVQYGKHSEPRFNFEKSDVTYF